MKTAQMCNSDSAFIEFLYKNDKRYFAGITAYAIANLALIKTAPSLPEPMQIAGFIALTLIGVTHFIGAVNTMPVRDLQN